MKRLSTAVATTAFALSLVSTGWAYRMGNPGQVAAHGQGDIGLVLELGERELDAGLAGGGDADITGLVFEGRYGIGNGLELRGRLIPMTTQWDLGDGYNPKILGLGAGVQWIPDTASKGPLTWGVGAGFDWGQGDDNGADLDYLDIVLNGGVSYAVNKELTSYGGLSFTSSNGTRETGTGSVDLDIDNPIGLFGGIDFKADKNWLLGAELRLISETMISLTARYTF